MISIWDINELDLEEILKFQKIHEVRNPEKVANYKIEPLKSNNKLRMLLKEVKFKKKIKQSFHSFSHKKISTLYVSHKFYYKKSTEGECYNQYIDPLIEDLGGVKLGVEKMECEQKQPFDIYCDMADFESEFWSIYRKKIIEYLRKSGIEDHMLLNDLYHIYMYSNFFFNLFFVLKPKSVAFPCYYNTFGLGLVLACKKLKIPSIDIQHGVQTKAHIIYGKYKVNNDKLNLIPDQFWVWSVADKRHLQKQLSNAIEVKVIGNIWAEKQTNNLKRIEFSGSLYDSIILFALQPVEIDLQIDILESLVPKLERCLFLIRLHPSMSVDNSAFKIFSNKYVNVEIEKASSSELYDVIFNSDLVLTLWSTVAVEAKSLRKNVIILHKKGEELFEEFIADNQMDYCDDLTQLPDLIKNKIN